MFWRLKNFMVSWAKRRQGASLVVFTRGADQYRDTGQAGGGVAGMAAPINNTIDASTAAFVSFLMAALSFWIRGRYEGTAGEEGRQTAQKSCHTPGGNLLPPAL